MNTKLKDNIGTRKPFSVVAILGFISSISVIAAVVIAAVGYREGWWHFTRGLEIFEWAAYGAMLALLLSVTGLIVSRPQGNRRGFTLGVIGAIIVLPVVVMALNLEYAARTLPPINDVTTDTEDPPAFWDVPNPVQYPGESVAALQISGYPDLAPLELSVTMEAAFEQALAVAKSSGWEIVASESDDGRIEATAASKLFGFKDDIVIRIAESDDGVIVDVRSRSRLGKIDRGMNAKRIRSYLNALKLKVAKK